MDIVLMNEIELEILLVGDLINSPFVVFNLICLASEQDFLTLFLKIPPFVT